MGSSLKLEKYAEDPSFIFCKPNQHRWRLKGADVLRGKLVYRCSRCAEERIEKYHHGASRKKEASKRAPAQS